MKRSKKAVIELQFNWLFILIIGAMILLFFVTVIYKQRNIADQRLAARVLNDLESILTGAQVSTSTATRIESARNEIYFDCTDCSCSYKISNLFGSGSISYDGKTVFAPTELKGEQYLAWSLDWNMPYKVTNFLYLTSPEYRYTILYNQDVSAAQQFAGDIQYNLPDAFTNIKDENAYEYDLDTMAPLGIPSKNSYKARLIFVGYEEPNIASITNMIPLIDHLDYLDYRDITAINIMEGSKLDYGTVQFYTLTKNKERFLLQKKSYYIGIAGLYAAIFSDDPDNYVCPMNSALQRLQHVSSLYQQRTTQLRTRPPPCQNWYSQALNPYFTILMTNLNPPPDLTTNADYEGDFGNLYNNAFQQNANGLAFLNSRAQLFSCPEMY